MRIPKVHDFRMSKSTDKTKYNYDVVTVDLKPSEYIDDMSLFENDKELHRFVIRIKYYIRKSYEYTQLIKFLKRYKGMNCCGIHPNIKSYDGFPIEIHHTPLVIEDIIYIIINKRIESKESLKMSAIAREVMYLHYLGLVGLYPLDATCHEYAHSENSDLFIPLDAVFGEVETFMDIYHDFIKEAMRIKFKNIQDLNAGYTMIQKNIPESLQRKYIYVVQQGQDIISTTKLRDFINTL